jgi:hypothetical protein
MFWSIVTCYVFKYICLSEWENIFLSVNNENSKLYDFKNTRVLLPLTTSWVFSPFIYNQFKMTY